MRRWFVFNAAGQRTAVVTAPTALELAAVSRDGVLVRRRDDLDVETVVMYPLVQQGIGGS